MTGELILLRKPRDKTRLATMDSAGWLRMMLPVSLSSAVLLWLLSLRQIHLGEMGGYGLISVLPVTFWIALGLLTIGFTVAVLRPRVNVAWLAGHVVALLAMLHATPTLLYGTLRYSWAWKHVAVVDYLLRHDGTDMSNGDLGVYNQWPGFFALNALLVRAAGLSSALSYAAWSPLINNLLLIIPLVLLYRSMTSNRRLIWTGVWVFFSCAWIGQDYFSPQAFAFVLYLTVIALVLNRLRQHGASAGSGPGPGAVEAAEHLLGSVGATRRPRVRAAVSVTMFPALLIGFALAYYGKERVNYFSPAEVAASQYMYSTAPHGAMIVGTTSEYPGGYTEYERYTRVSWLGNLSAGDQAQIEKDPAGALAALMQNSHGRPAYFILTRSQAAEVEQAGLLPSETLARVEQMPGNAPSSQWSIATPTR